MEPLPIHWLNPGRKEWGDLRARVTAARRTDSGNCNRTQPEWRPRSRGTGEMTRSWRQPDADATRSFAARSDGVQVSAWARAAFS